MFYSILHRGTGIILFFGALFFSLWLSGQVLFPAFLQAHRWLEFLYVLFSLVFLFALFFHLLNGVRHFVWDAGFGFSLKTATWSGHFCFFGALVLTLLVHVL